MCAPTGGPIKPNCRVFAGTSGSLPVAVNVYVASSLIVALTGTPPNVGASFTSATLMVMLLVSESVPSLTTTLNVYEPGPCDSPGVQVNTPVVGLMLAPDGWPLKLNVRVCVGTSGS